MSWERQINLKTAKDLEIMRIAGRINAEALAAARAAIQPGASTADVNAAAEEVQKKYGVYSPFKNYPGSKRPFPASTCVSINEELVHGIPNPQRKIKVGDIVTVDCGTVYEGFVGDSAFTVGVGDIAPLADKLIRVTEECLYAGIAQMVQGAHLGDIGYAIQSCAESNGFHVTRLYTGHGVGRKMHEGPSVPNYGTPGWGMKMQAGMTIALEPMLLVGTPETRELSDGWTVISRDRSLTAHFEHTVAVTENGPLILSVLEDGSSPVSLGSHQNGMQSGHKSSEVI